MYNLSVCLSTVHEAVVSVPSRGLRGLQVAVAAAWPQRRARGERRPGRRPGTAGRSRGAPDMEPSLPKESSGSQESIDGSKAECLILFIHIYIYICMNCYEVLVYGLIHPFVMA